MRKFLPLFVVILFSGCGSLASNVTVEQDLPHNSPTPAAKARAVVEYKVNF
jgi:uncharacterized protein YceK